MNLKVEKPSNNLSQANFGLNSDLHHVKPLGFEGQVDTEVTPSKMYKFGMTVGQNN